MVARRSERRRVTIQYFQRTCLSIVIAATAVLTVSAAHANNSHHVHMSAGGGGDPTSLTNRTSQQSGSSHSGSNSDVGAPYIPNKPMGQASNNSPSICVKCK
jgi:hypothetical protein